MKKITCYVFTLTCLFFASALQAQQPRRFLLRDEGLSQLAYVDQSDPSKNWYTPIPTGRDIQLIGNGRVLIGTDNGYEEREISTGNKIYELTSFAGTIAARRLSNGNTMLVGVNWQGKQGIVLVEINANGSVQRLITYAGFTYARLMRETVNGTFLITADDTVFEGDLSGKVIWQAKIKGRDKPHAWQALRLANGQTVVSTGYAANLQFFGKDGNLVNTIAGPPEVKSNFYAGMQILPNGNYVVINWEGHGKDHGAIGTQLLEYTNEGKLAWSWQQDASHFSSLHAVIILDGIDTNQLHLEDVNGILKPVKINRSGLE
ncbi:MAG: hypothetical protein ABIS69_10700 [Sediminibacterium sp.]